MPRLRKLNGQPFIFVVDCTFFPFNLKGKIQIFDQKSMHQEKKSRKRLIAGRAIGSWVAFGFLKHCQP
jgi:hypothetical protein